MGLFLSVLQLLWAIKVTPALFFFFPCSIRISTFKLFQRSTLPYKARARHHIGLSPMMMTEKHAFVCRLVTMDMHANMWACLIQAKSSVSFLKHLTFADCFSHSDCLLINSLTYVFRFSIDSCLYSLKPTGECRSFQTVSRIMLIC